MFKSTRRSSIGLAATAVLTLNPTLSALSKTSVATSGEREVTKSGQPTMPTLQEQKWRLVQLWYAASGCRNLSDRAKVFDKCLDAAQKLLVLDNSWPIYYITAHCQWSLGQTEFRQKEWDLAGRSYQNALHTVNRALSRNEHFWLLGLKGTVYGDLAQMQEKLLDSTSAIVSYKTSIHNNQQAINSVHDDFSMSATSLCKLHTAMAWAYRRISKLEKTDHIAVRNNLGESVHEAKLALQLRPDWQDARYQLKTAQGLLKKMRSDDATESTITFSTSLDQKPADVQSLYAQKIWLDAESAYSRKDYRAAKALYAQCVDAAERALTMEKSLRLYTRCVQSQARLGIIYYNFEQYDEAQKSLRRSIEAADNGLLFKEHPYLYEGKGFAYAWLARAQEKTKQEDLALLSLKQSIQYNQKSLQCPNEFFVFDDSECRIHTVLASVYLMKGRLEKDKNAASEAYNQSIAEAKLALLMNPQNNLAKSYVDRSQKALDILKNKEA